jgi:hypothetical protein
MKCIVCGKETTRGCSRCKIVGYCSRECQAKDWPEHGLHCDEQREIYRLLFAETTSVGGRKEEEEERRKRTLARVFPFGKDPREAVRRRIARLPPRERSATYERLLALAEGHHPRLGQGSPLFNLPRELLREVADILIADDRRPRLAVYDRDAGELQIYLASSDPLFRIAKYDVGIDKSAHSCPTETSLVTYGSRTGRYEYASLRQADGSVNFTLPFRADNARRVAATKDHVALGNDWRVIVYSHNSGAAEENAEFEFSGAVHEIVPFCGRFFVSYTEVGLFRSKIIDPFTSTKSRNKLPAGYVPCAGWKMLIHPEPQRRPVGTISVAYVNDEFSEFPVTEYVATEDPNFAASPDYVRVLGGMVFYATDDKHHYIVYAPPTEPPFPAALDPLVIDDPFYLVNSHSYMTEIMCDTVALRAGDTIGNHPVYWIRRDAAGHIRVTSTPFPNSDGLEIIGLDVAAAKACVTLRQKRGGDESMYILFIRAMPYQMTYVVDVLTGKVEWSYRFSAHEEAIPILVHLNR